MAELTRRSFLTHASIGVGVAGGALAGVLTALPRLREIPLPTAQMPAAGATEPVHGLIAHVRDASTGEIAIMVGTREVIHRDRSLAMRLMDVAHQSPGR
jgi:hypothetical protein